MASVSSQQNASMELIPGMDKLLNHMKEQDKKIKELQEENKKLQEGQIKLDRDLVDMVWDPLMKDGFIIRYPFAPITDHLKILVDDYKKVKEENKKLQEENKKLQEWCLSTEMIDDTSAETIEEFERDVRDNWKENTEFTEEIDELKEKITCLESDSHNEVSQAEHEEQMENTLASLNFYKECNEELKKTITRLQKERNYLGDYEGGATSESEEEEEDEYPETLSSIDKQKFMTVFTNEDSYRIYEKDEDVAIRQGDNVRGRLIFNGEGDPDSVKFIIDSDYEMKEGEMSVQYWGE